MAMTASLKEMVRPVSIPPLFERSCGALMQVSFGRPSSHTTKKLDRARRDASIHRESAKGCSRILSCADKGRRATDILLCPYVFWYRIRSLTDFDSEGG